jgi:ribose transport system substrate-binding protein
MSNSSVPSSRRRPARRPSSLVALLLVGALVAGCVTLSKSPDASSDPSLTPGSPAGATLAPGPTPTAVEPAPSLTGAVGYISLGEQLAFARAVSASVRDQADGFGLELITCDSRLEAERVRACAEELGAAGVRGAISFGGFPELGDVICEALHAVPVVGVAYDQGPCQVSLAGTDNHAAGMLAGEALGRFSQERWDCDISAWVSLESSAAGSLGAERMAGYRDGYERHCPIPADRLVVLDGADRVVTAQRSVARLLEGTPGDRILVVGINEDAVTGALAAARGVRRADDVWVSGQGADPSARRSIACDEHYVASVAHLPERFGEVLVPTLLDALAGRDVPPTVDTPIELVSGPRIRDLYPDVAPCEEADPSG